MAPMTMGAASTHMQQDADRKHALAFVVTEDWFFASHFLPMAQAAIISGLDVFVLTRVRNHRAAIEATGAKVIPVDWQRGSLNPLRLAGDGSKIASHLIGQQIDIVHAIALQGIIAAGLAARRAKINRAVYAVTGLGFLGAAKWPGAIMRGCVGRVIQMLGRQQTIYLFENPDDAVLLRLPSTADIAIVGGAGIDPDALTPSPLPDQSHTLRIAIVARMLWSKGIDIAVEAVRRARAQGCDVTLSLFGAPDEKNPRSIKEDMLRAWTADDGVTWHGPTDNVAAVWRDHHLACAPSRGGEGLPRSILEAAACGRGIITTDVPGCRWFVRNNTEGLIVPPGDAAALAAAMITVAKDRQRVAQMGQAARMRVLDGFTHKDVQRTVTDIYKRLLTEKTPD